MKDLDIRSIIMYIIIAALSMYIIYDFVSAKNNELPELDAIEIEISETAPHEPMVIEVMDIPEKVTITTVEEVSEYEADKELIASVVMAESKGEKFIGKVAVASVILNRCDYFGLMPKTIISVPNQFADPEEPNDECIRAVEFAIENRDLFPETMMWFKTNSYHTDPHCGVPYIQIGNHYFNWLEK